MSYLYVVKNNPTINGLPAGQGPGLIYLAFAPGTTVGILKGSRSGSTVEAVRLSDGMTQTIDRRSLKEYDR